MASNPERRSVSGRLGATPVGWRHSRVGRILCYGPLFSLKALRLTLGGRRATMVAGVGGAGRRKLGVDDGGLWGSSG
jgi:hypothetical protein